MGIWIQCCLRPSRVDCAQRRARRTPETKVTLPVPLSVTVWVIPAPSPGTKPTFYIYRGHSLTSYNNEKVSQPQNTENALHLKELLYDRNCIRFHQLPSVIHSLTSIYHPVSCVILKQNTLLPFPLHIITYFTPNSSPSPPLHWSVSSASLGFPSLSLSQSHKSLLIRASAKCWNCKCKPPRAFRYTITPTWCMVQVCPSAPLNTLSVYWFSLLPFLSPMFLSIFLSV